MEVKIMEHLMREFKQDVKVEDVQAWVRLFILLIVSLTRSNVQIQKNIVAHESRIELKQLENEPKDAQLSVVECKIKPVDFQSEREKEAY